MRHFIILYPFLNTKRTPMLPQFCFKIFLSFCCVVLFFSCNPKDRAEIEKSASAFDIKQGEASISQSNQNFMKAFETADSTGVANSYTTDAKIMAANIPAIIGRDEIKHFISTIMKTGMKDFQITTLKIWGDSSILAEEGTYKIDDSADVQIDTGKYIVLWKQESGNWKMFRDIWTTDLASDTSNKKTNEINVTNVKH